MIARKNRELFLLSLQVLASLNEGTPPSRRSAIILRRHAAPGEETLPLDELCCALIHRELGRSEKVEIAA
jgi:hypothetical protein